MGKIICKLLNNFCCCCCCCCCSTKTGQKLFKRNTVGVLPVEPVKILLLGLVGSGKTEVGHWLSGKKRLHYDSTNGVQYFKAALGDSVLSITEIGGNVEMQKIWHHYYVTNMGFIYCFDLSASYEFLSVAFELLQRVLQHPFMHGKPVLVVATKSNLANPGVQLYDIENNFHLEAMAKTHESQLRLCSFGGGQDSSGEQLLWDGLEWLTEQIKGNYAMLRERMEKDAKVKTWQQRTEKLIAEGKLSHRRYERFRNRLRRSGRRMASSISGMRPRTAPPAVYFVPLKSPKLTKGQTLRFFSEDLDSEISEVPNHKSTNVMPTPFTNHSKNITEVQQ